MTAEGTPRRRGRTLRRWLALPVAAGFALALAAPAHATFPGDNGKLAYHQPAFGNDSNIYVVNPDGSGPTAITTDNRRNRAPEWSADGAKIAFEKAPTSSSVHIWTMNADGSGAAPVGAGDGVLGFRPAWSPDGSQIAFDRLGNAAIWVMDANGANVTTLPPAPPGGISEGPDWSPDGTKVASSWFEGGLNGARGILLNDLTAGTATIIAGGPNTTEFYARVEWSADGSKIIFARDGQIWSINPDGTGEAPVGPDGDYPAPAPDGTKIAAASIGGSGIAVFNPDGSGSQPIINTGGDFLDWQPIPDEPDLQPVQISKTTTDTSVEGKWIWKMGKWTTSPLERKLKGPAPYTFKVLVDSHGFKVTEATILSQVTLTNPNDEVVSGNLTDVLPGWACEVNGGGPLNLPANDSVTIATRCTFTGDPNGAVTNTATFTPEQATGLDPVSAQATTTVDETPPPNSPGQKVALRDPMYFNGTKVLRYLDAVGGPTSITATYTVKLIPPVHPGKCWWHHNIANLRDVATSKVVLKSNKVSVYICRPKDAPKGTPPKDLPKVGKDGIPIVTPKLGGPKVIPAKYRTRIRSQIRAPRRVFRGQAFRAVITTRNLTRKRAFGTIVKVKIPTGMRVATKQRGIRTKGRYAYWTVKAIGPRKRVRRALKLVAIRPGAKRIRVTTNARNAKRTKTSTRVIVRRAPRSGF